MENNISKPGVENGESKQPDYLSYKFHCVFMKKKKLQISKIQ